MTVDSPDTGEGGTEGVGDNPGTTVNYTLHTIRRLITCLVGGGMTIPRSNVLLHRHLESWVSVAALIHA